MFNSRKYILNYKLITLIFVVSTLSYFTSCSNLLSNKNIGEGEIVFDVTYPNIGKGAMIDVYPKELKVKFKNNKVYNDFSTGMGMISIGTISDPDKKCLYQTFKMLADKTAAVFKNQHIDSVLNVTSIFKVEKTFDTKTIAGLNCTKVKVLSNVKELGSFEAYYTDELKIKNSNWWTPFKSIEGFLMEYEIERYGIRMHLKAREIKNTEVTDDTFILSSEYKIISISEMDNIMKSLM